MRPQMLFTIDPTTGESDRLIIESVFGRLGMDLRGHPLVGLIAGRAYFNLNTMIACARCVPGMGEKGITEMFGGEQDAAAAIVTDMGVILSHGSIVAREYGIPAVVNAAGATGMIKTGQTIRVDGSRGTVEVLR